MVKQLPLENLDPSGGSDGEVVRRVAGVLQLSPDSAAYALTVKDEGTSVDPATTSLDFIGANVTATTDGSGHVTVTVSGSTGTAGELLMQDGVTAPPVPIETEARDDWLYSG